MANTKHSKGVQPDLNKMNYREISKLFDRICKSEKDLELKIAQASKKLQDLEQQYKEKGELKSQVVQAMEFARQRENQQSGLNQSKGDSKTPSSS
ncbi:hypothetical protein NHP200010_16270 [Helicobacter bizzozeronii]|uniref:hypothetical protein n=1 Tax=Helicobacter bizzozeronii TaxID=56877 RepID=UPI00244D96DF|nr:hypothetical protein [Helicobacter bizzozeronii]GMB93889.1 hypothetical protein NHP200010_16270 [Helicobacter bizzozeronii]